MSIVSDLDALYEVVHGVRVELPPRSIFAAMLASNLSSFLGPFVRDRRLGRVVVEGLFILDEAADLRRRPDVAYVSAERWPLERPLPLTGDWAVIPDLAVEVQSPHDTLAEIMAKLEEYFARGVRQYWLLLPGPRLLYLYDSPTQVRILSESDTIQHTIVPGFTLALAELFR